MNALLPVMLGGALGAGLRYVVGLMVAARFGSVFPWATLSINILGSLVMGIVIGWFARHSGSESARLFISVGLLGGFTTFSSFSMEFWMLFERGQSGAAAAYAAASMVGAITACGLGLFFIRQVAA